MPVCIKEALRTVREKITLISFEIVPLELANGRILAEDILATISLPPFNNSAMDGYGVKLNDSCKKIKVIDTILAGDNNQIHIKEHECIKIMTGAKIPSSVEAVVPKEFVEIIDKNTIKLPNNIKKNQHIRFLGEDIKKGTQVLQKGQEINFASITILASQGISYIKVYRKPNICVFSSGEELKMHYENISEAQIYNSNTPTLQARVQELGCTITSVGMAKDSKESIKEHIKNSLHADLIITSGGVSVGDADFTKDAFMAFEMDFYFDSINIKPGKPTTFGKIGNTYILNLPGNPLAAAMIFEIFGTTILQKLKGSTNIFHNCIVTKIAEDLHNKKGRTTLIPGFFDGECFKPESKRLPGMVGVLNRCNSYIILGRNVEFIQKNTPIKIIPINWSFFSNQEKDLFN
jgi:molybdopterin molybdotransferase